MKWKRKTKQSNLKMRRMLLWQIHPVSVAVQGECFTHQPSSCWLLGAGIAAERPHGAERSAKNQVCWIARNRRFIKFYLEKLYFSRIARESSKLRLRIPLSVKVGHFLEDVMRFDFDRDSRFMVRRLIVRKLVASLISSELWENAGSG